MWETRVWSLGREDPLEKEIATHSSIHAWKIPRTKESAGLQSMGSQRVGHDWATSLSLSHQIKIAARAGRNLKCCCSLWWAEYCPTSPKRSVSQSQQPMSVFISHGKRDFENLEIWRLLDYSGGPSRVTVSLWEERRRVKVSKLRHDDESQGWNVPWGRWKSSRSWKRQWNGFSPKSSRSRTALVTFDFRTSDLPNYKL